MRKEGSRRGLWAAGLGAQHADSGVPALGPTLGHLTPGCAKASGSHAGSSNGVADAQVRRLATPTTPRPEGDVGQARPRLLGPFLGKRRDSESGGAGGRGWLCSLPAGVARWVLGVWWRGGGGSSVMPAALEAARGTDTCPAAEAPVNSAHTKDLYHGGPVRSVKAPGAHAPGLNANSLGEPRKLYPPPQFAVGTDAQMVGKFVQSHCPSPGHLQAQ